MSKPNAFWRKVLGSDEAKIIMTTLMFRGVKVKLSKLRTPYQLSSMVVVASCSGAILLPVVRHKVVGIIKKEDYLQILCLKCTARWLKAEHT